MIEQKGNEHPAETGPIECRVCGDVFWTVADETRCPSCDKLADESDQMHALCEAIVSRHAPHPTHGEGECRCDGSGIAILSAHQWAHVLRGTASMQSDSARALFDAVEAALAKIEDVAVEVTPEMAEWLDWLGYGEELRTDGDD